MTIFNKLDEQLYSVTIHIMPQDDSVEQYVIKLGRHYFDRDPFKCEYGDKCETIVYYCIPLDSANSFKEALSDKAAEVIIESGNYVVKGE